MSARFRWACALGFHSWTWEKIMLPGSLDWYYAERCRRCDEIRQE